MITAEEIAQQLRQPTGEAGLFTANAMNQTNSRITELAIHSLNIQDGDHILEIGMGNGKFVASLLSDFPGVVYTGCDFSPLMVEEAISLNQKWINEGRASFLLADAASIPLADESFDKVFCVNVIYFWEQPSIQLDEICRLTRQNGLISIAMRSAETMLQLPFTKYGFTLYEKQELKYLLEENNYKVVSEIEEDEIFESKGEKMTLKNIVVTAIKS